MANVKKHTSKFLFTFLILLIGLGWSCSDVIVEKIENDEVVLLAPANGAVLDSTNIAFWWDPVDGATEYQLQIVSPSFQNAVYFVADSFTFDNRMTLKLNQGEYEWAVRALNSAYETDYFTSTFTIDTLASVNSIADATIVLNTPVNDVEVSQGPITFWWDAIEGATQYKLQVVSNTFDNPETLVLDSVVTKEVVTFSIAQSGNFEWRVRAENAVSESAYTTESFVVVEDTVTQDPITLVSPENNYRTSEISLTYSWAFEGEVDFFVLHITGAEDRSIVVDGLNTETSPGDETGSYEWFVTGVSSATGSSFQSDTLGYELVVGAPLVSTLVSPENEATVSAPFDFVWNRNLDNIERDSLYLFDESETLIDGYPIAIGDTTVTVDVATAGNYKWALKSVDSNENVSELSELRDFTVE